MNRMRKLTNRYKAFVEFYLQSWNASESARRAGFRGKYLHTNASKLLQNTTIAAEISRRLDEIAMDSNEVLARLAQHARGSFEPFLTPEGTLDLLSEQGKANIHLIKKMKTKERILMVNKEPVREIETEIEIHDPQAALVQIGRHHGLFVDKQEINATVGLKAYCGISPDDWDHDSGSST